MIPAEPRHLFALSLGFAAALLAAEARAACGPRAAGIANTGAVAELLLAEGGSRAIITLAPDGARGLVAAGQDWMALPVKGAPV